MKYEDFEESLNQGAQLVRATFAHWQAPVFYMQFSAGFEIDGLFDGDIQRMSLSHLPGMPSIPTPDGHEPVMLYGCCDGLPILACLGHRHMFEGLGVDPCIIPLGVAWKLGIRRNLFVDPALSLIPELKPGNWAVLTDFINGHHQSPLEGLLPLLSHPFTDMTHALSQRLNSELVNALARISVSPRLCIYQSLPGAHFCTPAEANAARAAQADLIGHDLVMEIIMAHALECEVSALALVTESAPQGGGKPILRQTMLDTCRYCSADMVRGLRLAVADSVHGLGPLHQASLPSATAEDHLFQDFKRPSGQEPALRKYLRRSSEGGQNQL